MFGKNKKQPEIFYLLPGMARMARKRFFRNLRISIIVGIVVGLVVAFMLYYKDKMEGL